MSFYQEISQFACASDNTNNKQSVAYPIQTVKKMGQRTSFLSDITEGWKYK